MGLLKVIGSAIRNLCKAAAIVTLATCCNTTAPPPERAPDAGLEQRVQQLEQRVEADEARHCEEIRDLQESQTALRASHDYIMRAYRAEQREDLLAIQDLTEDQYAIVRAYVTGNLREEITSQTSATDIARVQGKINQLKPRLQVEFATEAAEAIIADKEYHLLVQLYAQSDEQTQAYIADCVNKTIIGAARANQLPQEDARRLCEELYAQETLLGQRFGNTDRRLLEARSR